MIAIEKLSPAQRAELDAFLQQGDDAWDHQMATDAQAGKLDRLLAQVDANIDADNLREFPRSFGFGLEPMQNMTGLLMGSPHNIACASCPRYNSPPWLIRNES
jgi:hypothetical protein